MNKMVWGYDPRTFEYTGVTFADPSPEEDGVWLMPANTTELEPTIEAGVNEVVVWQFDKWGLYPDYRWQIWFTDTGTPVTISTLGDPSEVGLFKTLEEVPDKPPAPEVPDVETYVRRLYKSTLVKRLTLPEAVVFEKVVNGEDAYLRLLYNSVEYFEMDDALIPYLDMLLTAAFGEERAIALLVPDA